LNIVSGGFELDNFEFIYDAAPNDAPTGVDVDRPTGSSVELNWDAVAGAAGYNVKRAETEEGPYEIIANSIIENTYVDEDVEEATTYYYKISAVNRMGEGPDSEIVSSPGIPPLSVRDHEVSGSLQIYPNPSQGQIHVDLLTREHGEVTIQL